jgi:hypothetical protein
MITTYAAAAVSYSCLHILKAIVHITAAERAEGRCSKVCSYMAVCTS